MAGLRILIARPKFFIQRGTLAGLGISLWLMVSACQTAGLSAAVTSQKPPTVSLPVNTTESSQPFATYTPESTPHLETPPAHTPTVSLKSTAGVKEDQLENPASTPALLIAHQRSAEEWKSWPVVPEVPEAAREIYQRGLRSGTDPHAFSILGDCQSLSETFMGVYETDPALALSLPEELQAVLANFAGSFNRPAPTIKGGTTAGAVLWAEWHENQYTCSAIETPLECELRVHNPSIVIINLGTHYETRNASYLRKIIDQLIERGVLPILSTKADNRELDERLNLEMAQLAIEYNIPLWNFWNATLDLPNHGVGVKEGEEHLGEIYLSEEGLERHRLTALQSLEKVWQAVK